MAVCGGQMAALASELTSVDTVLPPPPPPPPQPPKLDGEEEAKGHDREEDHGEAGRQAGRSSRHTHTHTPATNGHLRLLVAPRACLRWMD
jgi:hypothetical protein